MAAASSFAPRIRALALVLAAACAADSVPAQPRSAANLASAGTPRHFGEGARPGALVYPPTRELVFLEEPDLALGGPMPLVFQRYYAQFLGSDGFASSRIGTNWLGTFDWKLIVAGMNATLVTHRGRVVQFTSPLPGTWELAGPGEIPYQLVEATGEYRVLDPNARRVYTFDPTGRPIRIEDGRGNAHVLTYTGALLTRVGDLFGRELLFTYDAMDRLETVTDGTRTVSYGHAGDALTSFTNAAGRITLYNAAPVAPPGYAIASVQLPAGNVPWVFTYTPSLEVSSATDAFGRTWSYSVAPGAATLTDPNLGTRTYEYDPRSKIVRVTNPLGHQTSYGYDAIGRLTSVTRPVAGTTTFSYHAGSGYLSAVTLPDLRVVTLGFTERNAGGLRFHDLGLVTYFDGTTQSYTHDASGNPLSVTDRAAQVWNLTWTGFGMPATITNPATGVTTLAYDIKARVTILQDAAGVSTEFSYDAMDRLVRVQHPDLSERTFAYDELGNLIRDTNEVGAVSRFDYNLNGLLRKVTDPVLTETEITYDAMDFWLVVGFTDATGIALTYDPLHRLRTATDRTGRAITYTYDAASRLIRIADPDGNERALTYDADHRVVTDSDPLGNSHAFVWAAGTDRVAQWIDPLANLDQYGYDAMDRLTSANGPLGYGRTFAYDPRGLLNSLNELMLQAGLPRGSLGQITSVVDPNFQSWQAQHDVAGRVIGHIDPAGRMTSYSYDGRGRLSQATRTAVGTLTYAYDAASRVTQRAFSDGTVHPYTYDAAGRLLTTTGVSRTFDPWGRILSSNGIPVTRDPAGRITGVTYAPGRTVTYTYDTRGLLDRIQDWLGGIFQFTHDAAGRRTRVERPNGTITDYQYDAACRLVGVIERRPPDTLSSTTLTRDARGQVTAALRRVPLRPPAIAASRSYGYDDASQVAGWSYDGLGRLTDTDGPGPSFFEYNLASDLLSYHQGGVTATFTYDGLGRPVSRSEGAVTRDWVWNDALTRPSPSIVRQGAADQSYFLYSSTGEFLARYDTPGGPCCAIRYSHFDETGNTLFLTDAAGNVTARYAYTPYGEPTEVSPDPDNLFTFAGQFGAIREGASGLYRVGDRIYDSQSARFLIGQPRFPTPNTLSPGKIRDDRVPEYPFQPGLDAPRYQPKLGDRVTYGPLPAAANPYQFSGQNPVGGAGTGVGIVGTGLQEPSEEPGFVFKGHEPWGGRGSRNLPGGSGAPGNPTVAPGFRSPMGSLETASPLTELVDALGYTQPGAPLEVRFVVMEPVAIETGPGYSIHVLNPPVVNPPVLDPAVLNPAIFNPAVLNPGVLNPSVVNPPVLNAAGSSSETGRARVTFTGGGAGVVRIDVRSPSTASAPTIQVEVQP